MVSLARAGLPPILPKQASASILLVQLKEAHEDLGWAIENVEQLTGGTQPKDDVIANSRWRISQASLRRRVLAVQINDFLAARLHGQDLVRLAALRQSDQELVRHSGAHTRAWTIHSIRDSWAGYCAASRDIRKLMNAHLLLERQLLYPMLEGLARTPAGPSAITW